MSAGRRAEQVEVFGRGRVCAATGCDTVLSTYNPATNCALHKSCESPPRARSAGGARPSEARLCGNPACGRVFETSSRKREYCGDHCRVDAFHERKRRAEGGGAPR
jgi:hypothetical protein